MIFKPILVFFVSYCCLVVFCFQCPFKMSTLASSICSIFVECHYNAMLANSQSSLLYLTNINDASKPDQQHSPDSHISPLDKTITSQTVAYPLVGGFDNLPRSLCFFWSAVKCLNSRDSTDSVILPGHMQERCLHSLHKGGGFHQNKY